MQTLQSTRLLGRGDEACLTIKINIEGAEQELFSNASDAWLKRTRSIAVEIHSQGALDAVLLGNETVRIQTLNRSRPVFLPEAETSNAPMLTLLMDQSQERNGFKSSQNWKSKKQI
jgi:hypothetical protein